MTLLDAIREICRFKEPFGEVSVRAELNQATAESLVSRMYSGEGGDVPVAGLWAKHTLGADEWMINPACADDELRLSVMRTDHAQVG